MNIELLKQLINKGESDCLEFKKSTTQIKGAFETLCAFLNGISGYILIGVKDNGQIIGQHINDKTKQELAREISKIEPPISPKIYYIDIGEDKHVIVIKVPQGAHIPYAYDGRPFERNQSTTERMSQHRYEQLIVKRGHLNHDWEKFPAIGYTIDDLDHEEIRRAIREGVDKGRIAIEVIDYSIEQILKNLDLIDHDQLINAAVVLFAKSSDKIFTQCEIKMARFRGMDRLGDFIDNQWISGNAFQLIKAAHDFTSRHLPIAGFFEPGNWQRIDQPAIPALALREALINAICHRDYIECQPTTSLAIYDDRLELWNVGELSRKIKIESLKIPHNSVLRNKIIAQVFYKRGWIENWGIGTLRMTDYCKNNKTPEPEFEESFSGFSVTFPFKEPMNSVARPQYGINEYPVTSRQTEILQLLSQGTEMTTAQIRALMQNPPPIRTLKYDLTKLKQNGLIDTRRHARSAVWFLIKK